jgi:atypical dual specificity phosphatase
MEIRWVEPGILAASGIPFREEHVRSLHEQGIRSIVSLTEHPLTMLRETPPELFERLDMVYFHAPIDDGFPPSMDQAQAIVQHIEVMREQQRPTLVHCHAGIGRTGTILHLYFLSQGLSLEEAKTKVRHARRVNDFVMLTRAQQEFVEQFARQQD